MCWIYGETTTSTTVAASPEFDWPEQTYVYKDITTTHAKKTMGQSLTRTRGPHGCALPLRELQRLWPNGVLAMDIVEQAKLADDVCRARASDVDFCRDALAELRREFPHAPPTNTTGVGNMAYMALNARPDARNEFMTLWSAYTMLLKRVYLVL